MKRIIKRIGICLSVSVVSQFAAIALGIISPLLTLFVMLPGWAFIYAGERDGGPWGFPLMLGINAIFHLPVIYLLLWWRPFREKELLTSMHLE